MRGPRVSPSPAVMVAVAHEYLSRRPPLSAFPERAAWGTAAKLRAWQEDAIETYIGAAARDFLAVATPGAGKTTFALRIATELIDHGVVQR